MLDNHHFKQFTDTLKRSEAVVKGLFPVKGPTKTLSVTNLRWTNVGPEVLFDVEKQKQAKLKEQSLNAVLVGDLKLTEEGTGKVLDQVTKYPLLAIPHLTMNAGYIVDGKERQVINQFRLRPGIYTRFTGDDNVEAFLNTTAIGTYKIILERSTGVIRMRVGSTATTPIASRRCSRTPIASTTAAIANRMAPRTTRASPSRRSIGRSGCSRSCR